LSHSTVVNMKTSPLAFEPRILMGFMSKARFVVVG
jgi:hypothetical protein